MSAAAAAAMAARHRRELEMAFDACRSGAGLNWTETCRPIIQQLQPTSNSGFASLVWILFTLGLLVVAVSMLVFFINSE